MQPLDIPWWESTVAGGPTTTAGPPTNQSSGKRRRKRNIEQIFEDTKLEVFNDMVSGIGFA